MAITKTRNKVTGPAQITPLTRDVVVLRKINWKKMPGGIYLKIAEANVEPGIQEQDLPWFSAGYICNDMSHSPAVTEFIMRNTKGFAIARTDNGEILKRGTVEDLETFDQAVARAKVQLSLDISLDDNEDEDEDLDDEDEELENLDDE